MEEAYSKIVPMVLLLGVIALVTGTMAVVNGEFGQTMTHCYNSSYELVTEGANAYNACTNATAADAGAGSAAASPSANLTSEYYVTRQGQEALSTVGEQQVTLAIIVVMVIIILALISVFAVIGMRKL